MFMPPRYEMHRADSSDNTVWRDAVSGWVCHAPTREAAGELYLASVRQSRLQTIAKYLKAYAALPVNPTPVKRRLPQRPFKFKDYNSTDDIMRRIRRTMVLIGKHLYFVGEIAVGENDFLLIVWDHKGDAYRVWYSDPNVDLRAPDPRYLMINHRPYYVSRWPTRTQTQGVERNNTYGKPAGSHDFVPIPDFSLLLKAWETQEDVVWDKSYSDLMTKLKAIRGLRLSNDIAVYFRPEEEEVWAEYKGRSIGIINGNTVKCDDMDAKCPWIYKDFRVVGLEMRV